MYGFTGSDRNKLLSGHERNISQESRVTYSVVCKGCTEVLHVPSPNPGSMQRASTLPPVIVTLNLTS